MGKYPWRNNNNPGCKPGYRCGRCRKDKLAIAAKIKWENGTFQRGVDQASHRWSREEIEIVERLHGKRSTHDILAEVNVVRCGTGKYGGGRPRTLHSLKCFAHKRGWSLRLRGGYHTPELASAFGVSTDTILRWIEGRFLDATRDRYGRYEIAQDAIEAFIVNHSYRFDLSLMDRSHRLYVFAQARLRGEEWLSTKQLAARLNRRDESHLRDYASKGVLPSERRGKSVWMFRASQLSEIREILEQRLATQRACLRVIRLKAAA